ncbi:MAG TPA: hypothetical protein DEG17_07585 [Cyanobacteria bacterium UBA11149]|nr:hypothetical protein [Cyanobacteria bacterium UBA11367]HBE56879.1 hypothetical protein [Cyanobacteria bacterium UBA11366]HBK63119.1 hypothetical protein [Cyanobacteria bacterium UBA11166]HBR73811.1 hypothetical protein [Cyanobacteria bacterium UBA11159]HBS67586.1 hypothetical protein [Cyanobacteria bacterium UBA11153]HBW88723.1 hypothetical protein [Cyanobacteria bacterium UBA11149]HCA93752.1 hypothetical protein [Cyanobacteria bacterium UBA9226]
MGEKVSKSNIKSTLRRYHYSNFSHSKNLQEIVQINSGNVCPNLPKNEPKQPKTYQDAKLEAVPELVKEGLTVEQIARVLKLPLELVQQQIQNSE